MGWKLQAAGGGTLDVPVSNLASNADSQQRFSERTTGKM
jgi:hypothetical protein